LRVHVVVGDRDVESAGSIAPDHLDAALTLYRDRFRPSELLERPHVMAAMTVIAADTDAEAQYLSTSLDQSFVALRTGNPGKLKPPIRDYRDSLPASARAMLEHIRAVSAVGSPATVRTAIDAFIQRTGADEIMVAGATFDPEARSRSLALTMDAIATVAA
jgi:alkanesulfonate monooxygenase SsuD/methylene tetrahydromethanopterin reductase-like flavin-dependent oxidoreductase (luciferase family)